MNTQPTLLFIVGSAQKAKDGVADYTLRLARALEEKGVRCRILAWSEPSLQAPTIADNLLRLPSGLAWRAKLNLIKPWYDIAPPDKVSLQFVPYAFDSSGLPERLAYELAPVIHNKPLQVFMHELWVMPCMRAKIKDRLLGYFLQRPLVVKMLKQLKPALIQAAVPHYVRTLEGAELSPVRALPLFGNILFQPITHPPFRNSTERHIGLFGSLHASLIPFCKKLCQLAEQTGLKIILHHAGNASGRSLAYWNSAQKAFAKNKTLRFERFGHLAPREASFYFQTLDFVASTYSPVFYCKSGVIAAAREHGKPVLLLAKPENHLPAGLPEGVYEALTPALLQNPPAVSPYSPLSTVADSYYYFLTT